MRTTQGSALFADAALATRDGLTPSRLRAAGAIVVGKTNLPEFATEGYTANLIFGVTRNPWGFEWSPGGSSGGSGAALAAGLAPIATATDGGGSVRIPAALCGLPAEPLDPERLFSTGNPDKDWFDVATAEHVSALGREVVKQNLGRMHPGARWFMEEGLRVTLEDYLGARRRRFGYVRELDELLGEDGVVLSPTIAAEGWLAEGRLPTDQEVGPLPAEVYNTSLQNTTGHPALSLPAGRLPNRLPFGLQITGPRFRDHLLLDLADSWEEAWPWPRVADGYEPFDAGIAG